MYSRPGLSLQHLYDVRMRPSMGGYPFTCLRGQQQPAGRRHTAVRAPAGRPGTHTQLLIMSCVPAGSLVQSRHRSQ